MAAGQNIGQSFRIVLVATFVGFCAFYAPQPLLPTFATAFGVSATASAWLLTLPFFCLAIGPILVGSVLQHGGAQRVLAVALLILSLSLVGFSLATNFETLLFFRAIQALMLPIVFTASLTYCSRAGDAELKQNRIAIYISTTILGGFSGRLIGGFAGEEFGWQAPFTTFALCSFICSVVVWFFVVESPLEGKALRAIEVFRLVKRVDIRSGLAFVFTTFFTFSGTLNVIPFRLVELEPDIPASKISLVYIGYSVGIFIPLAVRWVVRRTGGEIPTLLIAFVLLFIGLVGLFIPSANLMLIVFLVLSMGMFAIHAVSSGLLNMLSPTNPSLINGAYISNYYAAAAVGSVIPVWVVSHLGWNAFVILQLLVALTALWHLHLLRRKSERIDTAI